MTTNGNLSFVKARGLVLAPMSENEEAFLNSKRVGAVLEFPKPKEVRNPFFHRKFFALLNLGFDYWEPTGGTLSPTERKLLEGFAHYLGEQGGKFDVFESLANHYMDAVALRRAHITAEKSFEAYRRWVAIEAGFFDVTVLPNGIIRKEAKSIAFASMDDSEFRELYQAAFTVIWNHILYRNFRHESEVDAAVNQLLGFA
ncbi:DUF1367 family protein [Parasalinivibrio latis]|uniref:DUF1367 family protein n=1 Tax=Parasalinivibrio latis TaxID=2952610 RepID=UPI0030DF17A8